MELISTSDKKHIISLPPSCVNPSEYKVGDEIEYNIKGTVKSTDKEFGVQVELSDNDEDPNMDEFEDMEPEEQEKKIKKQMGKNKLEEY